MEELRGITEAEWRILQQLWQQEPMTIMQLTHALEAETGWTKHTMISFLNRMEEKNFIFYEESGRARQYYSLIDSKQALAHELQTLMRKTASESMVELFEHMFRSAELMKEEREQLRRLVNGK